MINRLLHDVAKDNTNLVEKLSNSKLLGLVRELHYKYKIVVYELIESASVMGNTIPESFCLTDGQGLPIGRIFMLDDSYCYHAPYVSKERGADEFDRHTIRSKKLSTLMATLKRMNIVTSSDEVLDKIGQHIHSLVHRVMSSFPYMSKSSLDGYDAHILLSMIQEGNSFNDLTQSNRDKYLEILDKYKEADILSDKRKQGTEEMFNDTYLVFGDMLGHYMIADAGYVYESNNNNLMITIKSPFKRVKNLKDYPRVLSALTMNKVHSNENFRPYSRDSLMPMGDKYIPDLELVHCYQSRNSIFDMGMVCLAK
jgi:hypothetical protein